MTGIARSRPATRRRRRLYMLAAAGVALGIGTALVLNALRDSVVFFYSPTELAAQQLDSGRLIRIGGLVEEGSVEHSQNSTVRFAVTDMNSRIHVTYQGILPDLFRERQGVVAQGWLREPNRFEAREVLAKHDETYMPREVAAALKNSGQWKPGGNNETDPSR